MPEGGEYMAGETPDTAKVNNFFTELYQGERIPAATAFRGLGSKCDECSYCGGI